jgi:hypothetical protein
MALGVHHSTQEDLTLALHLSTRRKQPVVKSYKQKAPNQERNWYTQRPRVHSLQCSSLQGC